MGVGQRARKRLFLGGDSLERMFKPLARKPWEGWVGREEGVCRYLGAQGELFQRGEGKKDLPVWQKKGGKQQPVHSFQQEVAAEGVDHGSGF